MLPQIVLAAALLAHPHGGAAEPEPAPEAPAAQDEAHPYHWLVAGKIITGTSRAAHGNNDVFGPGMDIELTIWPEAGLELELAAALLISEELHAVPVELLLKKAFHVGPRTDLFFAAGGVVNYVHRDTGEDFVIQGAIFTTGGYLWHSSQFGLVVEMAYALYIDEGSVEHDLEGAVGIAHRW